MQIQHKQTGAREKFFVNGEDEKVAAEIVYTIRQPNIIIIEHTEVSKELRGKNIGLQLVNAVAKHARTNNMKIIAICTFAKSIMDKKDGFQDVMDK